MPQPHSPRKAPPRTMVIAAALAVAGLVGFGASLLQRTSTPSPQAGAPSTSSAPVLETIYFDAASVALPAQASDVLARVADTARTGSASIVVAAFHDSADGERGLALASQRAQAVAHGLEANGVARDRLVLASPAPGADEREARRVEIRIE
jgi:outer membrane protein OmpA-like peptidoglycan-associated protein